MSFKSKNLSYDADASQPAFLRRLRGEVTNDDSARHEQPIPRNKRLKQDEEEDAPSYVLEDTNQSLTKAEYEALVAGKGPNEANPTDEAIDGNAKSDGNEPKEIAPKDNIAEAGKMSKKRKAIRVIGADEEDDKEIKKPEPKVSKKLKKKAKPVKLSFGDQEQG